MQKILFFCLTIVFSTYGNSSNKTVFLAILARDKAHCLPLYLKCIESLDYDKNLITIYINTNDNKDNTEQILKSWVKKHDKIYHKIIFDSHKADDFKEVKLHEWTPGMLKILGKIRDKSLRCAKKEGCDFYFVIDCDNFITPCTLKELIAKDKPIIAPMLQSWPGIRDFYSNFFCAVNEWGYYKIASEYYDIISKKTVGTFKVPVVHCTYLIKNEVLDQLTYIDDTNHHEFVIFSRSARKNKIDQFICNEEDFGHLLHVKSGGNLVLKETKATRRYLKMRKITL